MRPRILAAVGVVVLAASGVWEVLRRRADALPEGALAGGSLSITVGEPASALSLTVPQWGLVVAGAMLVIAVVWELRTKRAASAKHDTSVRG